MARSTASIVGQGVLGFFSPLIFPYIPLLGSLYNEYLFQPCVKMFMNYLGVSFSVASSLTLLSVMLICLFAAISNARDDNEKEQKAAQAAAASGQQVAALSSSPDAVDLTKATITAPPTATVLTLSRTPQQRVQVAPPYVTPKPTGGRMVAYRVMQFLMVGWTLFCGYAAVAGMFNVASDTDPLSDAGAIGVGIGLMMILIVWLVPMIGLAIITYFVRPRPNPPIQIVYMQDPQTTSAETTPTL